MNNYQSKGLDKHAQDFNQMLSGTPINRGHHMLTRQSSSRLISPMTLPRKNAFEDGNFMYSKARQTP